MLSELSCKSGLSWVRSVEFIMELDWVGSVG